MEQERRPLLVRAGLECRWIRRQGASNEGSLQCRGVAPAVGSSPCTFAWSSITSGTLARSSRGVFVKESIIAEWKVIVARNRGTFAGPVPTTARRGIAMRNNKIPRPNIVTRRAVVEPTGVISRYRGVRNVSSLVHCTSWDN